MTHETRFKHTRFGLDGRLNYVLLVFLVNQNLVEGLVTLKHVAPSDVIWKMTRYKIDRKQGKRKKDVIKAYTQ